MEYISSDTNVWLVGIGNCKSKGNSLDVRRWTVEKSR